MSSSSAKPTNLKEVFFSHAALGKIQGNPTYEDIQKLYRQCKANAKSVPCVLGGVANGHLGLIISPLAYARIAPGTPYTRALHPGVLAPPGDAATGFQITEARTQHNDAIRLFMETNMVQQTIVQQINE